MRRLATWFRWRDQFRVTFQRGVGNNALYGTCWILRGCHDRQDLRPGGTGLRDWHAAPGMKVYFGGATAMVCGLVKTPHAGFYWVSNFQLRALLRGYHDIGGVD